MKNSKKYKSRKVEKYKAKTKFFSLLLFYFSTSLLFFTSLSFASNTDNPSVDFYKANIAYEQGKFDEAIKGYEKSLNTGIESGNIYYNLGNAYFKKGEIGKAMLNYKRAQRIIGQDSDLKANMDHIRSVIEPQVTVRSGFFTKFYTNIIKDLSIDGLTVFLMVLYLFIFLMAVSFLFIRSARSYIKLPLIACCIIFVLAVTGFFIKISQKNQPWAVILDKEVDVRYEPFDSATVYFKIYQGHEALFLKAKGGWAFIKRPDGKVGWIKASSIEKI